VYELTASGRNLEPVIISLARWGQDRLGAPDSELAWRPAWTVVALRGRFDPHAALGIDETYQFVIDGQAFWASVNNGELRTGLDRAENPAVMVTAGRASFLAVAAGELPLEQATDAGDYRVEGDPEALRRAAAIFPTPTDPPEKHDEPAAPNG
jgi:hypothetical protein